MALSNQELIEKATITTDAIANAGKLNPIQANKFLDYVFDETMLAKTGVRTVKFSSEEMLIEKMSVGSRVALPAAEAADPNLRRGISTSKISITPVEIMVPFEIGSLFKEENIEGDSVEDHIIKMMATQCGNNVETLLLDGNNDAPPAITENDYTGSGSTTKYRKDSYLALMNGLLLQAESGNVVDAANAQLSPALVAKALRALPNKFKRDIAALRLYTSWNHEHHYREGVSTRATGAGDQALSGTSKIKAFGVTLEPLSLLDPEPQYAEDSVANNDGTTATALTYGPISELVLTPTTLGDVPVTPYVLATDYTVDEAAGTWTRLGGGSIPSGGTVRATYKTAGRKILTRPDNIVMAIGRDVTIEKDRNIFRRVNEYAITLKVYVVFEEVTAVTLLKNVQVPT